VRSGFEASPGCSSCGHIHLVQRVLVDPRPPIHDYVIGRGSQGCEVKHVVPHVVLSYKLWPRVVSVACVAVCIKLRANPVLCDGKRHVKTGLGGFTCGLVDTGHVVARYHTAHGYVMCVC
jgi:hypothetical protein